MVVVGLAALALGAGWTAARPATVTVDGRSMRVPAGSTVASLQDEGVYEAPAGDLIAVDGSVLATGSGQPPRVLRNGRPALLSQRVYGGDSLASLKGLDRRESIVVTDVPIPFGFRYTGKGSLSEVRTPGSPGMRRVTMGLASGAEVSSKIVSLPVDAVIERMRPAAGTKVVALTFDDGPWPGQTDRILDVLRTKQVRATFFMLGVRAKSQPEIARRVADEGHLVGNHSVGHRSLARSKAKEARRQIERGRELLEKYTGVDTPWLRPPYGEMDKGAWRVVRASKSRVVMWNVDSHDWEKRGVSKIVKVVVKNTKPGAIVLMHDGGGDRRQTVKALPIIIDKLRAKGYKFVTIDEMYAMRAAQ